MLKPTEEEYTMNTLTTAYVNCILKVLLDTDRMVRSELQPLAADLLDVQIESKFEHDKAFHLALGHLISTGVVIREPDTEYRHKDVFELV